MRHRTADEARSHAQMEPQALYPSDRAAKTRQGTQPSCNELHPCYPASAVCANRAQEVFNATCVARCPAGASRNAATGVCGELCPGHACMCALAGWVRWLGGCAGWVGACCRPAHQQRHPACMIWSKGRTQGQPIKFIHANRRLVLAFAGTQGITPPPACPQSRACQPRNARRPRTPRTRSRWLQSTWHPQSRSLHQRNSRCIQRHVCGQVPRKHHTQCGDRRLR